MVTECGHEEGRSAVSPHTRSCPEISERGERETCGDENKQVSFQLRQPRGIILT